MQAYHFTPLYDKIMHTLSGTLGMFLGFYCSIPV